jgi:hypothetical protein
MASFKSDITNKSFSQNEMREFEITDETQSEQPQIDLDILNARMASRGLPPISEDMAQQLMKKSPSQGNVTPQKEVIAKFNAAKNEKAGKGKLSDIAKKRVEALLGLSRPTKTVEIDGIKFVIRTLKTVEMKDVILRTTDSGVESTSAFEFRKQILARSIVSINDNDIDLFLASEDEMGARLEFIEELDDLMAVRLHAEYMKLTEEAAKKLEINSEEKAQEVAEEIKK